VDISEIEKAVLKLSVVKSAVVLSYIINESEPVILLLNYLLNVTYCNIIHSI
jgi:hypothetical protein